MKTVSAFFAILFVAAGCHTITPPPNFMPVQRADLGDYDQRVVSADGVVIGVRSQSTHSAGTLEFWSQALANELVASKGYQLASTEDAPATNGRTCKVMTFRYSLRGNSMTYLLAVFVDGRDVLLAEAGGKSEAVQKQLLAIRQSLLSAR
jgi:hypothetical protein